MNRNIFFLPPELWDLIIQKVDIKIMGKLGLLSKFLNEIILNNRICNYELQLYHGGVYDASPLDKFEWACKEGNFKITKFILENETVKIPSPIEGYCGGALAKFYCLILYNLSISDEDKIAFYKLLAESFIHKDVVCGFVLTMLMIIDLRFFQHENFHIVSREDKERLLIELFETVFEHTDNLEGIFSVKSGDDREIEQTKFYEKMFVIGLATLIEKTSLKLCNLFIDKLRPLAELNNGNIEQTIDTFGTIGRGGNSGGVKRRIRSVLGYINEYNSKKVPK